MQPIYEAYKECLLTEKYKPKFTDKDLGQWGKEEKSLPQKAVSAWIKQMSDKERQSIEVEMVKDGFTSIADQASYDKYRKHLIKLCKKHKVEFTNDNDNYDLILRLEDAGIDADD